MRKLSLAFMIVLIAGVTTAEAVIPKAINYQGKVTDSTGQPLPNGTYNMRFFLWSQSTNGSLLWQEPAAGAPAKSVEVIGGLFNVLLGSTVQIPDSILTGPLFLQTEVNGVLINPRIEIVSVLYSRKAGVADSVIDNSITSAKIVDSSIRSEDIEDESITSEDIRDSSIIAPKLSGKGADRGQVLVFNGDNVVWGIPAPEPPLILSLATSGNTLSVTNLGIGRAAYFAGRVGITGATTIGSTSGNNLSVTGGMTVDASGLNAGTLTDGLALGSSSGEGIASRRTSGANQNGLDFYTNSVARLRVTQTGDVGIGILPTTKLDVNGIIRSGTGGFRFPDGTTQNTAAASLSLPYSGGVNNAANGFQVYNTGSGGAIKGLRLTGSTYNEGTLGTGSHAVHGLHGSSGAYGYLGGNNTGVYGSGSQYGVSGLSSSGTAGYFESTNGNALVANGPVQLNGPGGLKLTIDSNDIYIRGDASNTYVRIRPNGDIEIKAGNDLTLAAVRDVKLSAGRVLDVDAGMNATIDAAVSLSANSGTVLTLTGSSLVDINGSMITLN